ncbi:MAG: leucyl/phenylalanyl-tRNA--protein transferase [Gammaproteobacteria bacterium]|nr:leucyl/phenylalanyl-tRNA--protein transferase [Gammaproteobacteria bacterium]NNF62561.1 leucyl/phenylalanyl-tRNA--protein transferase [Gammaproteobacteria bacterium]NNM20736.1 leucyl/phenylalanyl-tRNA--protein transferase [Gammaproteobacteria bacterium]
MKLTWLAENSPANAFPDISQALQEPNGLLAAGGDLSTARLVAAYRRGIFPWYEDGQPILWWSPEPRAVLFPGNLHVSRSLRRTLRRENYTTSFDRDFAGVVAGCARDRPGQRGTWITPAMAEAYVELHRQGYAHSVEVWRDDKLAGGIYGVSLGRVFYGESMFSRHTDASKIALLGLVRRLQAWNFELIDCQIPSAHLMSLGAELIPRERFLAMNRDLASDAPAVQSWREEPPGLAL